MTKDEALDLALEALEHLQPTALTSFYTIGARDKAITAIKQARALDKKAENARELGLDYEPVLKDNSNYRLDPPVAEPVTWRNAAIRVGEDLCSVGPFGYYDMTAEQWLDWALSVVTVHAPPAAQRQWVGLTDEEIAKLDCYDHLKFARAIEAKLKEKNGLHRQHVIDGSPCWCEPETSYTDPETGASVVVHKEPQ